MSARNEATLAEHLRTCDNRARQLIEITTLRHHDLTGQIEDLKRGQQQIQALTMAGVKWLLGSAVTVVGALIGLTITLLHNLGHF